MRLVSGGRARGRALLLATSILGGLASMSASAQTLGQLAPPPVRQSLDENGVDVVTGAFRQPVQTVLSIGPDDHRGLSLDRLGAAGGLNSLLSSIEQFGGTIAVTLGTGSDSFTPSGNEYVSTEGNGATLVNAGGTWIYTSRDGTKATFASNAGYTYAFYEGEIGRLGSIVYPDGTSVTVTMKTQTFCPADYENGSCLSPTLYYVSRVQSVTNSNGYQLKPVYASNAARLDSTNYDDWGKITDVIAINNKVEACDPAADTCAVAASWPRQSTVAAPPAFRVTATPDANGRTATAVNRGVSYTYAYYDVGSFRHTTVTAPDGGARLYVSDTTTSRIISFRDELNRLTNYSYDTNGRLTEVNLPEGNIAQYAYDARGNVTQRTAVAKPNSGLAAISTTAGFEETCSNAKTCNKPVWTKDALGNQTDYTYDPTHGGILTVTPPAPVANGIRPQTRYGYALADGVYRLTTTSACRTSASCTNGTNGADEVRTTIAYGPASSNYLPTSVTSGAGDGSLVATTSVQYDAVGNVVKVDGPLPDTADTTSYLYDASRRVTGIVGPDPDGTGPLKNRAVNVERNGDWQVTTTTAGTADADGSGFVALRRTTSTYDADGREVGGRLEAGGTTYAVTQQDYDSVGRPLCSTVRINPLEWGTLPPSACALQTTGADGPDRITRTSYDVAGQVTKVTSGFGTPAQADDASFTYTGNGQQASLTDGNGNRTGYVWDGHDRWQETHYPSTTTPGTSSSTDYEGVARDVNGNVLRDANGSITSRRLRDGVTHGYSYDALGRLTLKDLPTGENDTTYSYNLIGQMTGMQGGGVTQAYTYDLLGRLTQETQAFGSMAYQYDLASRRTRVTWNDGYFASYDQLVTGEVSAIRENDATSGVGVLATYAYDDLGERTSLKRGNGVVTTYGLDAVSRLTSLSHGLVGATPYVTSTFAYNRAGQITSTTRDNDVYAFNGAYNRNTTESVNGLNQLTAQGTTNLSYSGRGNVIAIGAQNYAYSSEDMLTSVPDRATLQYDPSLRLIEYDTGTSTRFMYDGDHVAAEIANPSGNVTRRYVWGPGADEPIVTYEGSGTGDRRWNIQDERGSVIAITNASGATMAVNRYDEFGVPASDNVGRFQYTGQEWLAEIGQYYYKARQYAPGIGRFMQPDPFGYAASPNLYGYVGGDPVNATDPSGYIGQKHPGEVSPKPINPGEGDIVVNGQRVAPLNFPDIPLFPSNYFGGIPSGNTDFLGGGDTSSQNNNQQQCQASAQPIAYTPQGDTKGENPDLRGDRYNTDLPGGYEAALATFEGLTHLDADKNGGDGGFHLEIDLRRPTTVFRSNTGNIGLRYGFKNGKLGYRVDINPNTFSLKKAETIHFNGSGRGNMCPTG